MQLFPKPYTLAGVRTSSNWFGIRACLWLDLIEQMGLEEPFRLKTSCESLRSQTNICSNTICSKKLFENTNSILKIDYLCTVLL
jgi:hypothetical protein